MSTEFSLPADVQQAGEHIEQLGSQAVIHKTAIGPGGSMLWHEWGSGPTLVLLHGGFGSWRHWASNIEFLAKHFRVLAADTPGLGQSDAIEGDITPDLIGEHVAHGLRELVHDAPLNVAAFSFGGVVAGATLQHFPGQVRSLTLCGASGMGLRREK